MYKNYLQIGVIGSAVDVKPNDEQYRLAIEIGQELAKYNAILVYGAEKDSNSIPTIVSKSMMKNGGFVIGVTYGKDKQIYGAANAIITTGLERGGGREMVLCLSCDAIISVGGGSGTLTEMGIAYQARVPIIALKNSGGWSKKLAGTFLDSRKRIQIRSAKNPKEAVSLALKLAVTNKHKAK